MDNPLFTRFSEIFLAASSFWGLQGSYGYDFACIALSMYGLSNTIGFISNIVKPDLSNILATCYQETQYCCNQCCIPLFTAQICQDARIMPDWFLYSLTMIVPSVNMSLRYLLDKPGLGPEINGLTLYFCTKAIAHVGLVYDNGYATLIANIFALSYYVMSPVSKAVNNISLAIACLLWLRYKNTTSTIFVEDFSELMNQKAQYDTKQRDTVRLHLSVHQVPKPNIRSVLNSLSLYWAMMNE